ncbi:hypothetical protein, partial [Streptomyces sp. NRRL B-24484]|uniref:hypothetical protein n=1 Tax=Streptomyces sp. NRRL B-24484 TaxID=1463833 RepID=UPI001F449D0B
RLQRHPAPSIDEQADHGSQDHPPSPVCGFPNGVFQGGGSEDVSVPQSGSFSAPVNVTSPGATLRNIAQAHPSTTRRA